MIRVLPLGLAVLLLWPAFARAQSGPLTESLVLEEPKTFSFRVGPLLVSPNLTLKNLGLDSNVFNEPENPKTDWTVTMSPDLRLFARLGLMQFSGTATNDFTYYVKYESERSVSRQFRGRLDAALSRIHPWVSAARVDLRDRPNREIDLRTRRTESEIAAGVSFSISPIAGIFAMATRVDSTYGTDQVFDSVDVKAALDRRNEGFSAGVKIKATPFTTVMLSGGIDEDRFVSSTQRNARSQTASASLEFSPEAALRGRAMVGYSDFRPGDANLRGFKGLVSSGTVTYTLLGRAIVDTTVIRDISYSFDALDGYYVETGLDLTYTQILTGPYDVQAKGSRRWLDYTRTRPGFKPAVDAFGVGVGYNFQDKSRIGLNYEYSQRIDDLRLDRRFHNRRFFGSYSQELAR